MITVTFLCITTRRRSTPRRRGRNALSGGTGQTRKRQTALAQGGVRRAGRGGTKSITIPRRSSDGRGPIARGDVNDHVAGLGRVVLLSLLLFQGLGGRRLR
jgi:hypothetical protein